MITEDNAAQIILDHRADKGITQDHLSEKSGVSVQTLRNIEKKLKKPQTLTIHRLQKYFDSLG